MKEKGCTAKKRSVFFYTCPLKIRKEGWKGRGSSVLSFFLAFTLAFQTPYSAQAQQGNDPKPSSPSNSSGEIDLHELLRKNLSPQDFKNVEDYPSRVDRLNDSFLNFGNRDHPLDVFHLLSQTVEDERKNKIQTLKDQIASEDFEARRAEEVRWLKSEVDKDFERARLFIGQGPLAVAAQRTGLNASTAQGIHQILDQALVDEKVAEILEIIPEQIEDFVDESLTLRRKYGPYLTLQVVEGATGSNIQTLEPIHTLTQRDLRGSTTPNFVFNDFYLDTQNQGRTFQITDRKGRVLHKFHKPIQAVGFFGQYLVYLEEGSFDSATKTLPVRFIDLHYFRGSIGNVALPVYTLPLKEESSTLRGFKINNGRLQINEHSLDYRAFRFLGDFYRVFFNLSVSLVDPRTHSTSEGLINQLVYFFDRSMDSTDTFMNGLVQQALRDLNKSMPDSQNLHALAPNMTEILRQRAKLGPVDSLREIRQKALEADSQLQSHPLLRFIEQEELQQDQLQKANRSVMVSRRFMSRLHMFMIRLAHPKPQGSITLLQAMAMVSSGLTPKGDIRRGVEALDQHPLFKYGKYGVATLAAAAVGSQLPEPFTLDIYKGLDLASAMMEHTLGYLRHIDYGLNYARLLGESAETVGSSLGNYGEAYVEGGRLPKLGVLMMAMIALPFMAFAVPHLLSNSIQAGLYMRRHSSQWVFYRKRGKLSPWQTFKTLFTRWRQMEKTRYDRLQSETESRISGGTVNFNNQQDEVAQEVLEKLRKREKSPWASRTFMNTKKFITGKGWKNNPPKAKESTPEILNEVDSEMTKLTHTIEEQTQSKVRLGESIKKVSNVRDIQTFGKALTHFMFSSSSLILTRKFLGTVWNYFFISRSFWKNPSTWYMALVYPKYFRTTIGQGTGLHIATPYNGGLKPVWTFWNQKVHKLFGNESLKNLAQLEKAILPVEAVAHELAVDAATQALIEYTKHPTQLTQFFDSADPPPGLDPALIMESAPSSTGISGLTDSKFQALSSQQRAFFQNYFTTTMNQLIEGYLVQFIQKNGGETLNMDSPKQVMAKASQWASHLKESDKETLRVQIKEIYEKEISKEAIFQNSKEVSRQMGHWFKRRRLSLHHRLAKTLNPKNPQVRRFLVAEEGLANPKAMLRATRAENASLIVNSPMSILIILALYAGVQDGSLLQPLHDQAFSPNSWFYGSRLHFLNGFAFGVILGLMANTWMKVQEDHRIAEIGGFDKVPTKADLDKGFWRYYFKSFIKNPKNKWWDNQKHYTKLIWANVPAAFITIAILNGLAFGRFDLGMFLAGYMVMFTTPFIGFGLKIEQSFELASSWIAAKVPRRLRSHPDLQAFISRRIQGQRLLFNGGSWVYTTALEPILELFQLMNTESFGKRSYLGLTFYGWQPEELVSKVLQGIVKVTGGIPTVGPAVEYLALSCESLLTNNNTALNPERLMRDPISK